MCFEIPAMTVRHQQSLSHSLSLTTKFSLGLGALFVLFLFLLSSTHCWLRSMRAQITETRDRGRSDQGCRMLLLLHSSLLLSFSAHVKWKLKVCVGWRERAVSKLCRKTCVLMAAVSSSFDNGPRCVWRRWEEEEMHLNGRAFQHTSLPTPLLLLYR